MPKTLAFPEFKLGMRKQGEAIAEGLVAWFRTGAFPDISEEGGPVYVPGDTFPVR